MKYNYYLIAHATPRGEALPAARVVASITIDPVFVGKLNPHTELKTLASKMGLGSVDIEITSAEAHDMPGHQLGLPFPPGRQRSRY